MRRGTRRGGLFALLVVLTIVGTTAAASPVFPASTYPTPVAARSGGALAACPNPGGLERFDGRSTALAVRIASHYDRTSETVDLRNSDRAWWPQVRRMWHTGKPGRGVSYQVVEGTSLGSIISHAIVVRYSCGQKLPADSLSVYIGPRVRHGCAACVASLFFVDRRGRPLIYYLY